MSEDVTPYGNHSEVVGLRLELARERDRSEAFRNALSTEVLKVMRVAVIQATIDADNEIARLKAEVERLRKAGDWMCGLLRFDFVTKEWNAAKEGKQS